MVPWRGLLAVAVAVVLATTAACTSNVQGTDSVARPKPSQKVAHPIASSGTPSSSPFAAARQDALSVTAVRPYPRGLVLAAVAGSGDDPPMRVLVSRNHGATFTDVTPAGMHSTDLMMVDDIAARGPARIWVAVWDADSADETVYRTTNGGAGWHAGPAPSHDMAAGATDSLAFIDAEHGWLVQQMPTAPISALYRTGDAGAHWEPVNRRLPQVAPVVADGSSGLWQAGGFFSDRLSHSTDRGHTWSSAELGPQPARAALFDHPAVFAGQVLEAVSSLDRHGEVLRFYRTRNRVTWSEIARLGPLSREPKVAGGDVRRAQVTFATPTVWWVIAADPRPTVYRTTDAGRHWSLHRLPVAAHVGRRPSLQIASSDRRHAWATITGSDTARLLATTDGGDTWAVVHLARRLGPTRHRDTARLPRCRSAQLRARVALFGSEASQPFVTIALRNSSATACALRGYPEVSAFGHRPGAPVSRLAIHARHESIYERRDPGPHRVRLGPGATASFNIGTATAYDGSLVTVTRLLIRPPGQAAGIPVHVGMYANGPRGRPIPVGVTALRRGLSR
jgi:hypothetical protein